MLKNSNIFWVFFSLFGTFELLYFEFVSDFDIRILHF